MPTYEYKCPAGHVFEKFFPTMHDRRREKCPTCGQSAERLISGGAGLVFKGSGFYITDYKRTSEKPDEKKSDAESKTSESKTSESKTPDAKPADSPQQKKPSGDK